VSWAGVQAGGLDATVARQIARLAENTDAAPTAISRAQAVARKQVWQLAGALSQQGGR
jgi:hypothetical protein